MPGRNVSVVKSQWLRSGVGKIGLCADMGATDVPPPGPWDSFAYTDGRIVTGANPASAHKTAEEAVKAFDSL